MEYRDIITDNKIIELNRHTAYIGKLIFLPIFIVVLILSAIYIAYSDWITEKKYLLAPMFALVVLGIYYYYMIKEHKIMQKYWKDKKG